MTNRKAKFEVDDQVLELPTLVGTEGEWAVDISQLRAKTGFVTLDNGFMNTSTCTSEITFLDGENGILRYRGYPIEELAEKSTFVEVSYLLMHGERPSLTQLKDFEAALQGYGDLPKGFDRWLRSFPKDAHPMAILGSATMALNGFYTDYANSSLTPQQWQQVYPLFLGHYKQLCACIYRHIQSKPLIPSNKKYDYCSDFLNMMFGGDGYQVEASVAKALDVLLILHADHEQNCSTSTVRLVGSSQASPFAAVAGGVSALWGPLHGGANQAVLEMLEQIQNAGGDYKLFLEKAKDKNSGSRLMGFGHRVYKNFDPRAKIIKKACDDVLSKLGVNDPLLEIAKGLESQALADPYFVERKLYPNVDFYSGIIYRALGIPTSMFTVMFALGRLPGWLSQWKEMLDNPSTKIGRPRQVYTGKTERKWE